MTVTLVAWHDEGILDALADHLVDARESNGICTAWLEREPDWVLARVDDSIVVEVLLDRVVLFGAKRHGLAQEAFDRLGGRLDEFSDRSRNLTEIETQLSIGLETVVGPIHRVLDWGCGTGLSAQQTVVSVALVGVDSSRRMRAVAESRGVPSVAPDSELLGKANFDLVIASYVLHLDVEERLLVTMVESVRRGGCVIANFHKARGRERVRRVFLERGLYEVEHPRAESRLVVRVP